MTLIDGHLYAGHGLPGMLGVDALSSIAVGTLLLLLFRRMSRGRGIDGVELTPAGVVELPQA
jgi:hypothetical protein